ncbi:hypothetical protein F383_16690 [Gossypium arboreum]|nr:hypothetical protein F383_16690 [Gossypium arboreum]
MGPEVWW